MNDSETPEEQPIETSSPVAAPDTTGQPLAPDEPSPLSDDDDLDLIQPRSIRRRIEQQVTPPSDTRGRVRSQPINIPETRGKRVREPVLVDWEPEPMQGPWRAKPFVIGLATCAWLGALGLLLADPQRLAAAGPAPRLLIPFSWALAAGLTFVPVQLRLALPGVGWQGMVGFALLGYLLAFVPAPTGWLLDLPDLPVYLLLFLATFYAITATMTPLTYLLGQRFYKLRIHRLDVGRARRQAYEVGLLLVVVLVMASLRVLSVITFGLLALVVILTEALLLSQVQPEG